MTQRAATGYTPDDASPLVANNMVKGGTYGAYMYSPRYVNFYHNTYSGNIPTERIWAQRPQRPERTGHEHSDIRRYISMLRSSTSYADVRSDGSRPA